MKRVAHYCITFGMPGYMPDSQSYIQADSRKWLAECIREELANHDMPQRLFREVKIRRLWRFIQRNGSSVAHFDLNHKGWVLSFIGMTEEEFNQQSRED